MISNIVKHKNHESYELVVATLCLDLLSRKFHDFQLVVNYNSFESIENDIRIHEICEIKNRAEVNSLNNAVKAIRNDWECGFAACYRNVIEKAGLETALERAILNWDIQVSCSHIFKSQRICWYDLAIQLSDSWAFHSKSLVPWSEFVRSLRHFSCSWSSCARSKRLTSIISKRSHRSIRAVNDDKRSHQNSRTIEATNHLIVSKSSRIFRW